MNGRELAGVAHTHTACSACRILGGALWETGVGETFAPKPTIGIWVQAPLPKLSVRSKRKTENKGALGVAVEVDLVAER